MEDLGCSNWKDEFESYAGRPKCHILQTFIMNCTWEGVILVFRMIEGTLKEVQI